MSTDTHDSETPEQRTIDGLLGLIRPNAADHIDESVRSALDKIGRIEDAREERMRIWPRVLGTIGGAAAVAVVILIFIMAAPESRPAIADIDRTLELMSQNTRSWYRVEMGRENEAGSMNGMEGTVCVNSDGRFVAFLHKLDDPTGTEMVVGNDGEKDWAVTARGEHTPGNMVRVLFDKLHPTITDGSIDPKRILRMLRQGWKLRRSTIEQDGRTLTRVEATSPRRKQEHRAAVDRITVDIDPESFTFERLEAKRARGDADTDSAYLIFEQTTSDRTIPGFQRSDYSRTSRPRTSNSNL